jgi:lysophospholipase L1-like esterase
MRHLRLLLLSVALLSLGVACADDASTMENGNSNAPRFLALGDSYTIGEGVLEAEPWPVQVVRLLRERGMALADAEIVARTGWTTDELAKGIDHASPRGTFALVSLQIGVNNQYRRRGVDEYRDEFRGLLRQAIGFAGGVAGHVLVLSIPDWGATPFAGGQDRVKIGHEIDAFNIVNREEALAAGARYVDVTPQSRVALGRASLVAGDGLHPSGLMYGAWAEAAFAPALEALAEPAP